MVGCKRRRAEQNAGKAAGAVPSEGIERVWMRLARPWPRKTLCPTELTMAIYYEMERLLPVTCLSVRPYDGHRISEAQPAAR